MRHLKSKFVNSSSTPSCYNELPKCGQFSETQQLISDEVQQSGMPTPMKPRKANEDTFPVHKDHRRASQGYVDIKNKTVEQLDELIERQNKLLQNRSFLEKLPDKGQKIISFKADLETERKKKQDECEVACQLLFNLTLSDKNLNEIEWNQEKSMIHEKQLNSNEESRKEDIDILKIVANHSGTASGVAANCGSNSSISSSDNDIKKVLYVDKFCEKYGKADKCRERFKPNQFRKNNKSIIISSAEKVKKILGSKWEVTEATPPVPIYNDTVMISLTESLKLQKEQAQIIKELNRKHGVEKLIENISIKMGDKLPKNNITEYRSNCYILGFIEEIGGHQCRPKNIRPVDIYKPNV